MPAASSSSANAKRKQDEKHYNILKELLAQDCNKKCFDCGQRGPVYVNMTIGAFVCTSCSGLLRGMNTPHRVKSVSMASFTPEEMDFIQKRGNDACYCVWMGRYEASRKFGGGEAFPESKDEHRLREYMHKKYEQKKWYVSEATALAEYEQIRQKNLASQKNVETPKASTKPHIPVPMNGNLSQRQLSSKEPSSVREMKNTAPTENKTGKTTASNNTDLDLIFGNRPSVAGATSMANSSPSSATNSQSQNVPKPNSISQTLKDPFAADPFPTTGASQNDFDPFTAFQSNANPSMKLEQSGFAAFPSSSVQNSFVADFGELKMSSPAVNSAPQGSLNSTNSASGTTGSVAAKEDKYAILASLDEEMKSSAKTTWSESLTVKRDPVVPPSNQGYGTSAFAPPQSSANYPVSWNIQTPPGCAMTPYTSSQAVYASGGFPNSTDLGVNPFGGPMQGSQTSTTSGFAAFGNFSSPQLQQPSYNPGNAQVANPFLDSNWGGFSNASVPNGSNDYQFSQPFGAGNTSMSGGISTYHSGGVAPGFAQSPYNSNTNAIHQHAISTPGAPYSMTNGVALSNANHFNMAAHNTFGAPHSSNFPGQLPPTSDFNHTTMMSSPFSGQPNNNHNSHATHGNFNLNQKQPMNNDWSRSPGISQGMSQPIPGSMGIQQPGASTDLVDPFASLATGMKSSVQLSASSTINDKSGINPWPNQASTSINQSNNSVAAAVAMKANPFLD